MNTQSLLNNKRDQKSELKKRRRKYITDKYNERSITNRLFK